MPFMVFGKISPHYTEVKKVKTYFEIRIGLS